jgi:F-type H+-transporting ATPase subunit delta
MIQNEVAKKYSQALFELGKETDQLIGFKDELAVVVEAIQKDKNLQRIIFHPRVLADDKKEILKNIFKDILSENVFNFLYLLIDKRRENHLELIYRDFVALVNKEENILEVEVISAIPLSRSLKNKLNERLKKNLTNEQIIIKEKIDPDIIGGLVIKVGDYVIDGSIRHSLNSLKEKIMQIPVSELGV